MATTFAAMRARLGDTEYYVLSMKAQDLVNRTKNGTALHDWTNLSVEERCRHEIDYDRIRTHIAPYLANDDARFFGGVILVPYEEKEGAQDLRPHEPPCEAAIGCATHRRR